MGETYAMELAQRQSDIAYLADLRKKEALAAEVIFLRVGRKPNLFAASAARSGTDEQRGEEMGAGLRVVMPSLLIKIGRVTDMLLDKQKMVDELLGGSVAHRIWRWGSDQRDIR